MKIYKFGFADGRILLVDTCPLQCANVIVQQRLVSGAVVAACVKTAAVHILIDVFDSVTAYSATFVTAVSNFRISKLTRSVSHRLPVIN